MDSTTTNYAYRVLYRLLDVLRFIRLQILERFVNPRAEESRKFRTGSLQNSTCRRTPKLRGGASAVPENRPAKLMTLSRFVRLTTLA